MTRPVYLDYQATTPVDPRVVEAMLPCLTGDFGNPGSPHAYGQAAAAAMRVAREQVRELLGAGPDDELVFTGSGTEAINLALTGVARRSGRGRIVITAIEHPAVSATCDRLAGEGFEIVRLPVDGEGLVDLGDVERAVDERTVLVSVIHANNEIGVVQPVREISEITRSRGALLHVDAAHSLATLPVDVDDLGVDLLTVVGHKMYAPKGIGALYVRAGAVRLVPLILGGGQERGLRSGTENVPSAAGLGAAARLLTEEREGEAARILTLRERLRAELTAAIPGLRVNGSISRRLPGNLSLTVPGVRASRLMEAVPELAFSAGAACHGEDGPPSPVLTAIGLTPDEAGRTIRIGLGRFTTDADVDLAVDRLGRAVHALGTPGNTAAEL
ncbi:cysteine desulfurase family protein [Streptosporangium sp. NPDC000396]|uniref:cysteine desulfurase family protein n=1 Tax=Streptosporangium sp. NPDC000396 TaxID=3366185 RepID=UPI003692F8A1